jgi:hypothetical protein
MFFEKNSILVSSRGSQINEVGSIAADQLEPGLPDFFSLQHGEKYAN